MSDIDRLEQQIELAKQREEKAKKIAEEKADRVKKLEAKRQQAEARELQKVLKGQRVADTRRKILMGVCLDRLIEQGVVHLDQVSATLDAMLKRPDERALFDLPPLPESQAESEGTPKSEPEDRAGTNLLDEMRQF